MRSLKDMKLFGVLRISDLIMVLVILVIVLPMIHYYVKFNEKGLVEQKMLERYIKRQTRYAVGFQKGPHISTMDVAVSFKNVTKEGLAKMKVHDKEILADGSVIAELLEIGAPEANYFIIDLGNASFQKTVRDNSSYSLPAKLRMKGLISDEGLFNYKAKALKELSLFTFNPGTYEVDFVVERRAGQD